MRYDFYNVNPLGKREEDCVTRAISGALNENYYVVKNKLELVGALFECEFLCECCYRFLLDYYYNLTRIEAFKGMSIQEFLNKFDNGTYIIRVDGHLTFAENGVLKDIWNCSDEIIDVIWKV